MILTRKLTRDDLKMMLEEMDKNNTDNIELDVGISGCEWELDYIDFDIYSTTKSTYIKTVLTLE